MNCLQKSKPGAMPHMKLRLKWAIMAAVFLVAIHTTGAQTNNGKGSENGKRKGQVLVPDRPTAPDANVGNQGSVKPPKNSELPPEVSKRVDRFKLDAKAYLDAQEALKKQMVGASDTERAALREQLRLLREKWLERSRELREEYKERRAELEDKLKDHRELFDELRNAAADRKQNSGGHHRRGGD